MQPRRDGLLVLEGQRPDIDIFAIAVHLHKLPGNLAQFVHVMRELDTHHAARAVQPVIVLLHLEQIELPPVRVPVSADALEDTGAVVERVRHHANFRLRKGYKLAAEVALHGGSRHQRGLLTAGLGRRIGTV